MKHVVVVGGGFAGVAFARRLSADKRFQITLLSDKPDFEYHAALYRSATGRSPLEVAAPLADILAGTGVELLNDRAVKLDAKNKAVVCSSGERYGYDELVLAPGMATAYFGISGLPEYSYGIKSMAEAMRLRGHLHDELTSGHKPELNYVVVGGGPSGVELAGELTAYLRRIRRNHGIRKPFNVTLVEAAPRILPALPERFARSAHRRLQRLGVKVITSTAVKGETAETLMLPEGNIDTHTVIWTAGMTNSPFFKEQRNIFQYGKAGRVIVEGLSAAPGIWVLGDSAATEQSGWAQTAVYDGAYLADLLRRREMGNQPAAYRPPKPVAAVPVGGTWCAVNLNGMLITGLLGWYYRRWADFHLYRQIMPLSLAAKFWIMGSRKSENCSVCRGKGSGA